MILRNFKCNGTVFCPATELSSEQMTSPGQAKDGMNAAFRLYPVDRPRGAPYLARFWRDVGYRNCLLTHPSGKTEVSWRFCSLGPERSVVHSPCHPEDLTCLRQVKERMSRSQDSLYPNSRFQGASPLSPCHPDRSVPGFPTSRCWQQPRVRLSVKREPHALHQRHRSQLEIRGSAVEGSAVLA